MASLVPCPVAARNAACKVRCDCLLAFAVWFPQSKCTIDNPGVFYDGRQGLSLEAFNLCRQLRFA
jgi:hypothetical protein